MAHQIFSRMINALETKLVSVENEMGKYASYFNRWPKENREGEVKVFSRKTKLTLRVMFWLIVSRIVRTLPVALDWFFSGLGLPVPGKGAFSTKRTLIKSDFFRLMNQTLVEEFYRSDRVMRWRGYILLACDGSRLAFPDVEELGDRFGIYHSVQGEELYPTGRACVFQDTLNNLTVYADVVGKDEDERYSFEEHYMEAARLTGDRTVFLLDRGYFSYNIIYLLMKRGFKFVMKAREMPWRTEFLKSGVKQKTVSIAPTRTTTLYRNEEWLKEPVKELTVRLVRFDHPDGSADVLVTNLMASEGAAVKDIIDLYRLRWPAETAYGIYKNEEALELFSSFRPDGILQDFHAAVILFNLASFLAGDCTRKGAKVKPDMNIVIGLIHNLCPVLVLGFRNHTLQSRLKIITREVFHYSVDISPGRSFPRIRRKRKMSGKFYRHTNFSIAV